MNTNDTILANLDGQAQSAVNDGNGDEIAATYISSVSYDSATTTLTFSSADNTKVITINLQGA